MPHKAVLTAAIVTASQKWSDANTSIIVNVQPVVIRAVERVGFCVGCRMVGTTENANTI